MRVISRMTDSVKDPALTDIARRLSVLISAKASSGPPHSEVDPKADSVAYLVFRVEGRGRCE
jgi:hypothetical protein